MANKKTLIIILVAAIVVLFLVSQNGASDTEAPAGGEAPSGATQAVLSGPSSVSVGDKVAVQFNVENIDSLQGVQVSITYDSSVLSFDSAQEGTFLSTGSDTMMFGDLLVEGDGTVKDFVLVRLDKPGASGSGLVGTFHFTAVGAGSSTIAFSDLSLGNTQAELIQLGSQSHTVSVS